MNGTCSDHSAVRQSNRALGPGLSLCQQHPGGEHAVEERLHQRGAEEMLALLAGELHAQGFFQGVADGLQGRQFLLLSTRTMASRA